MDEDSSVAILWSMAEEYFSIGDRRAVGRGLLCLRASLKQTPPLPPHIEALVRKKMSEVLFRWSVDMEEVKRNYTLALGLVRGSTSLIQREMKDAIMLSCYAGYVCSFFYVDVSVDVCV